jgi:biopolymer transport protein ExbB
MPRGVDGLLRGQTVSLAALLALVLGLLWSHPAAAWWNDQWNLRKKITIDTGPSGASVSEPIGTVPILVRLHVGNFRFGAAKEDGSDFRFVAADDKTPLKHHVEKYDSLLGEALVWVSVPDLKPGAKQEIWLYYGNLKASAAVDAKGTYDPDTVLVYHFADRGTPAQDVSAWANSAQSVVPGADGAIIGQGARLDGQTALTLPGAPSLVVAEGGELTWSAWVKMAAPQPRSVLYSRREGTDGLVIGLDNGIPFVEVTQAGSTQRSGDGPPITPGTWRHLAVTAKSGQIALFVDGNPFSTLAAALPTMTGTAQIGASAPGAAPSTGAPATGDPSAGAPATTAPAAPAAGSAGETPPATPPAAAPSGDTVPASPAAPSGGAAPAASAAAPLVGFVGDIDELQIAKTARPPGFIRVMSIGQGPENAKLISYSVDEETASWLSGYFVVILKSVTLDGWVVIGVLAIMAVISWVVMIDKASFLNRSAKGNRLFLKHFREAASDLDSLLQVDSEQSDPSFGGKVAAKDHKAIHASPLYRLLHLGAQEIRRRFSTNGGGRTLSPQAVEAIRAVLDSGFVQETQRLNRAMVMLTIAISGGPFLGLLGTVVGVMITFAAIAATGDVNVNAIAPGIAAALVATVAGLGVAIPALFGYNYLTTRIKDMTSEMQVFVDEFITKSAESYHARRNGPSQLAAE